MILPRTCPLCEATCGLLLTLDDGGRVTAVKGDPDDPFSRGFICPKGANLGALEADPARLRRPQIREGDGFRDATWDEAFAAVAAGLSAAREASGRDGIAVYLGNPSVHSIGTLTFGKPLIKALRTRNVFSASTVDQMPKHVSASQMFGHPMLIPVPDVDRAHTLLVLGANPMVSNGSLCTAPDFPGRLRALKSRGGRLIVVDPRRTETAARADEHLAMRPGGDAAWLMSLVQVLFDEERVDLGRLAGFTRGLDALRELSAPFTPEAVGAVTGIDGDTTRRIARELASSPAAAVYGRIGTCTVPFGTLASWLVDVVNVLTGNLDRPGGAMFPRSAHSRHRPGSAPGGRGYQLGRWRSRVRELPEVNGELPVATLADEIETPGEGQVRALVTVAGNPVLSTPGGERLDRALAGLDFMVSVDIYLNETTRHADVILPPAGLLARPHYDLAFYDLAVRNVARFDPPSRPLEDGEMLDSDILMRLALAASGQPAADPAVIDAMAIQSLVRAEVADPESPVAGRDAKELETVLAARSGPARLVDFMIRVGPYGDAFGATPDGLTLERLLEHPHGLDLGPLEPRLPDALRTRSGAVELAPESLTGDVERLRASLDVAPPELVLVGRRTLRSNNSWMHNLPKLVAGKPRCTLQLHPDDAGRLGLTDGADARVTSASGELVAPVEITDSVRPGVVSLPHGWGHGRDGARLPVAAEHAGVNVNAVTDPAAVDPLSGNAVLSAVPVTVAPA